MAVWTESLTVQHSLAYHEARMILAKVLWHFEFELCPESDKWLDQKVYLLWDKTPLMVKARHVRD
jgi:cytochrome P450